MTNKQILTFAVSMSYARLFVTSSGPDREQWAQGIVRLNNLGRQALSARIERFVRKIHRESEIGSCLSL